MHPNWSFCSIWIGKKQQTGQDFLLTEMFVTDLATLTGFYSSHGSAVKCLNL